MSGATRRNKIIHILVLDIPHGRAQRVVKICIRTSRVAVPPETLRMHQAAPAIEDLHFTFPQEL
jgi:hypothetical protein